MAPPQQRGRRPTGQLCLVRVWGRQMARGAAEAQGSHQPFPSWPCSHSTSPPPTMLPEEECWRVCGGSQVGTLRLRRSQTHWEQLDRDGHREWGLLESSCSASRRRRGHPRLLPLRIQQPRAQKPHSGSLTRLGSGLVGRASPASGKPLPPGGCCNWVPHPPWGSRNCTSPKPPAVGGWRKGFLLRDQPQLHRCGMRGSCSPYVPLEAYGGGTVM